MGEWKSKIWHEEEVSLLIRLLKEGYSASAIARELHNKTRNAVIGKIHRLKLGSHRPPRPAPQGRRPRARKANPRANPISNRIIASEPPLPVPPPVPVEGGVSIIDLEHHHCRAVVGTGPDGLARFCGAHKEGRIVAIRGGAFNSPYCVAHGDEYYKREAVIRCVSE